MAFRICTTCQCDFVVSDVRDGHVYIFLFVCILSGI